MGNRAEATHSAGRGLVYMYKGDVSVRLIDDRCRFLGLINPIDGLVVAALLVGVGVACAMLFGAPSTIEDVVIIEYDLLVPRLESFDPDSIAVGDVVTKTNVGEIGQVVSIVRERALVDTMTDSGLVWVESAGLETIRIRLRTEAAVTDEGYSVRGVMIRENAVLSIHTPGFESDRATVTDVEVAQ